MTYSQEIMDEAYELGRKYEPKLGSCSQCVLAAIMETIGGIDDATFQAVQGISGGTVSCGTGTCGALAGGIVAIGSRIGRPKTEFDAGIRNRKVVEIGRHLTDRFIAQYGGITCREVQAATVGRGYDLMDAADNAEFTAKGGHDQCGVVTGIVARWTIEILNEEGLE